MRETLNLLHSLSNVSTLTSTTGLPHTPGTLSAGWTSGSCRVQAYLLMPECVIGPPAPSTQHKVLWLAKGSVPVCSKPSFGYLLVLSVVKLRRSRGSAGQRCYDLLLMSALLRCGNRTHHCLCPWVLNTHGISQAMAIVRACAQTQCPPEHWHEVHTLAPMEVCLCTLPLVPRHRAEPLT